MEEPIINRETDDGDEAEDKCLKPSCSQAMHPIMEGLVILSRKAKRKAIKKIKRKQMRRELAVKWREEEEAKLNDPEEQRRIELMVREEAERIERERKEFDDRERAFSEAVEKKRLEQERRKALQESQQQQEVANGDEQGKDEDDEWEYIEEGPAEIIWQGNEITVKKKRIRVPKKDLELPRSPKEDANRLTSNPFPPESEAFAEYTKSPILSAQQVLENVSQQVPNFGTEQDKAHCPFHLKTGTCRFGQRCSRVHFYPDRSCTILIKNMYIGPGLAWEQDEGLEHTEEEVERCYEEFYEDVHTEFLKYGEIMNFKVCRNGSSHLRGNVYIHYKSLESAMAAYHSANGRFFAGKQVTCEYVNVTKWRVAICGEYMKSRYKTCSRGVACNFIHCFRNPGGDYEWADWDKPPPRYWVKEMAALFGYHGEDGSEEQNDRGSSRSSSRKTPDLNSKRKWESRSESRGRDIFCSTGVDDDEEERRRRRRRRDKDDPKCEEKSVSKHSQYMRMRHSRNQRSINDGSDDDGPKEDRYRHRRGHSKSKRRKSSEEHKKRYEYSGDDSDVDDKEEHGGDGCSKKSRRSWKHNNNNNKTEEECRTPECGGWDRRSCDSDSLDTDGYNSKYGDTRRKWRSKSNRSKTIDLADRWDPEGSEIGE